MSNDTPDTPDTPPPSPAPSTPPPSTPPPSAPPPAPSESDRHDRGWFPTALPTALVALGVGLVAGGIAVAAAYSREDGDLEVPVYVAGIAGVVLLLLVAVAGSLGVRRAGKDGGTDARGLVGWTGAVGTVGLAVLLGIGLEDIAGLGYLLGAVVTGLAVVGYLASRHAAHVVTAILGLGLLYASGFEDLYGGLAPDEHLVAAIAVALGVFVVAVSVLGWVLPTRVLSAQVAGWIGVLGCAGLLAALAVATLVSEFFGDMFGDMFGGMPGSDDPFAPPEGFDAPSEDGFDVPGMTTELPDLTLDVWVVLAVAAGLALLWILAAAWTKRAGFTLLAVVMPVVTVPSATVALAIERPTLWSVVLLVPGVLVLGGATLLAVRRR